MKKLSVFVCAIAMLAFVGNVHAYSWSLVPSGAVDTSAAAIGSSVAVNLVFNADAEIYVDVVDVSFTLDLAEVTPTLKGTQFEVTFISGFGSLFADGGSLIGDTYRIAGGTFGSVMLSAGANTIATIYLNLLEPATGYWNGSDATLIAQTGSFGLHDIYDNFYLPTTVNGPDYGSAPISPDSDGDGLSDSLEIASFTNPNDADTDNDGIFDGFDLHPLDVDADNDGVIDH